LFLQQQKTMHSIAYSLLLLVSETAAAAAAAMSAPIMSGNTMAPKGKKIQWTGHSFHAFLPMPVASLAKEAGIQGHTNLGLDMLPVSVPCQHWNDGGAWRQVITSGQADVLTIATREDLPDPCIPKFAQLAVGLSSVQKYCSGDGC
jgi:hypothetical protein